jgi:hypothetical protein
MFSGVHLHYYWLLLWIGIRLSSIGILIFIRYDVRVFARSIRSSITLFTLRERNIDDWWLCVMGRPGE